MRKIIIAGNWKMNKTAKEAEDFFLKLSAWEEELSHKCEIALFPPFIYLISALKIFNDNNIIVGAQNIYYKEFGAFTGEISAKMLASIGCLYSIVGHSERRHIFGENDKDINQKVKALVKNKQKVVLCIGEKQNERDEGKTEYVINKQLTTGLTDISEDNLKYIILAYEPVWAIGTGKTATPEIAQKTHEFIRKWIKNKYSYEISDNISILYGGSVKVNNIADLIKQNDIDGALIGGASLNFTDFKKIIEISEKNTVKTSNNFNN